MKVNFELIENLPRVELSHEASNRILTNVLAQRANQISKKWAIKVAASLLILFSIEAILLNLSFHDSNENQTKNADFNLDYNE